MESTELSAGGVRLRTLIRPGSPTILFLHGLAGHGGEWKQVCEHLGDTIGVIAPDQRAHGRSWDGADVEVDRAAYVNDAIFLIENLATRPVLVVGQSMGGIVATLVAFDRPDLMDRLVLIEAGIRPMKEAGFEQLGAWLERWPARFADEDEAARFFGYDNRSTPAWVDGLARTPSGLVRRFDPEAMLGTMRALASTSRAAEWREITVPTTLMRAAQSVIDDREIKEMVDARPNTQVIEIEDSGHDVHLDEPERVAAVLTDVMEKIE